MMRLLFWLTGGAAVALLLRLGAVTLGMAGWGAPLEPVASEGCRRVATPAGPEDVVVDPLTGLAYAATTDRRARARGVLENGSIVAFDPRADAAAGPATQTAPDDFRPHGLALWRAEGGPARLFAINHPTVGGSTIEVFAIAEDGALIHDRTIRSPALTSPNDLAAVGPDTLYVTNDRRWRAGPLRRAENALGAPTANLAYIDAAAGAAAAGRIVARGLIYANGVEVSRDGRRVYVAETLAQRITAFDRDPATGALRRAASLPLATSPDNLAWDAADRLLVAAHPRMFDFLRHGRDPNAPAPSQVLRIDPETGEASPALVVADGSVSAASAAAVAGEALIVGVVFDAYVAVCPLAESTSGYETATR